MTISIWTRLTCDVPGCGCTADVRGHRAWYTLMLESDTEGWRTMIDFYVDRKFYCPDHRGEFELAVAERDRKRDVHDIELAVVHLNDGGVGALTPHDRRALDRCGAAVVGDQRAQSGWRWMVLPHHPLGQESFEMASDLTDSSGV